MPFATASRFSSFPYLQKNEMDQNAYHPFQPWNECTITRGLTNRNQRFSLSNSVFYHLIPAGGPPRFIVSRPFIRDTSPGVASLTVPVVYIKHLSFLPACS